jgi:hypothetical protein
MVINSGNFSPNGNFNGYNTKGERIHIYKRQMDALGIKVDADFKQFFAIVAKKTYGARLDKDGNAIPYADGKLTMTRDTATAVFKTKQEYIDAHVIDATLDAEVAQAIKKEYTAVGITSEAELEELAGA